MKKRIRNSTAEFLIFTSQAGEESIEVRSVSTVNEHIKNIYADSELDEGASLRKFGNSEFSTKRKTPTIMEDWSKRLDLFLEFDEREILQDAGNITAKITKEFAESEFEKYRLVQDEHFKSDFDKLLERQQKISVEKNR
ncbi:Putative DNA-binding protein in cluster with Type I restriction-modification system [hydrothermal vent metagenome]|uniref:DNA-binding protein in cluster with Type I restriction-modification system n=1 Tax=hydrothermal vent metagenome TaxID=652676 RepID=A0A3B1BHU3_9ZZZZ